MSLINNQKRSQINSYRFGNLLFKQFLQNKSFCVQVWKIIPNQENYQEDTNSSLQNQKLICLIKLPKFLDLYSKTQIKEAVSHLKDFTDIKISVKKRFFSSASIKKAEAFKLKIDQKNYLIICNHKQILVKNINFLRQTKIQQQNRGINNNEIQVGIFQEFSTYCRFSPLFIFKFKQLKIETPDLKIQNYQMFSIQINQIFQTSQNIQKQQEFQRRNQKIQTHSSIQFQQFLLNVSIKFIYQKNFQQFFETILIIETPHQQIIFTLHNLESSIALLMNYCLQKQLQLSQYQMKLNFYLDQSCFLHTINYYGQMYTLLRQIMVNVNFQKIKKLLLFKNFFQFYKLSKYCIIQKLPIQKVRQTLNSQKTALSILNQLKNIPIEILNRNTYQQKNVIFYLMLGIPGYGKTRLLKSLNEQINKLSKNVLMINPIISNSSKSFNRKLTKDKVSSYQSRTKLNTIQLCQFLKRNLFQKQKFAFVILDFPYSQDLIKELCIFCQKEIKQKYCFYYQIKMIIPQKSQQQIFLDSDLQRQISYGFSLQVIIGALLKVQQRKNHETLNGQNIKSLSQMLHYISSIYENIQPTKLNQKMIGNINFITFNIQVIIDWKQQDKEDIKQNLRLLLFQSYKEQCSQQNLLWYFLQSLESIQIKQNIQQNLFAQSILQQTFELLPFLNLNQNYYK